MTESRQAEPGGDSSTLHEIPQRISRAWLRPPRPCFTFFHVLWLFAAMGTMLLAYAMAASRHWGVFSRILAVLGGAVVGLVVCHIIVCCFVIFLVIPFVGQMTSWAYEVECYMLSILGDAWRDAGKPNRQHKEDHTRE